MRIRLLLASIAALTLLGSALLAPQNAKALSGSEFQAGRIMDDSVFFNGAGMTAHDIQVFLNGMVPSCDTNGTQPSEFGGGTRAQYGTSVGYPPPYTCLRDYVQNTSVLPAEAGLCNGFSGGTKSAAQIIQEVSASCGINPRILLVLLQKEQSLVTDTWPFSKQFVKATGYACPDSDLPVSVDANQNGCKDEFEGFFKQIYYGARQYKNYALNESSFRYRAGRVNYIQYHPNTGCGGTNVYIQNQATAGLYNYTPYQPHQYALQYLDTAVPDPDNNPNTFNFEDDCAAYGNRNFWRQYNYWFGPTLGPLIRSLTSPQLYYTDGAAKYIVPSMDIAAQYGLGLNDVRYMHQQEVDAIPLTSSPNTKNLAQLIKSDSDSDSDGAALYLVSAGKKFQVRSLQQLADFGFNTNQISYMGITNIYRLPSAGFLENFVQAPSQYVYKAETGKKRIVFSPTTLQSINPSGTISKLSEYTIATVIPGQPYVVGDAVLRGPEGKLWLYQDGQWYFVSSLSTYSCWKFSTLPMLQFLSYNQLQVGTDNPTLQCAAQRSNGSKYLMNNVNKIIVQPGWGITSAATPLDRTIDRLSDVGVGSNSIFKSPASQSLYVLEGGKKRPILSMDDFVRLGYTQNNIITVDSGVVASLPTGPLKIASGRILKKSDGTLFVTNGTGKVRIATMDTYHAFGFSKAVTVAANQALLDAYSDQGILSIKFWVNGQALLANQAAKLAVGDSLKPHAGYTAPNSPAYDIWLTAGMGSQQDLTRFIKASGSSTVYYLENGQKRPISSAQKLQQLGGTSANIRILSPSSLQAFATGSAI